MEDTRLKVEFVKDSPNFGYHVGWNFNGKFISKLGPFMEEKRATSVLRELLFEANNTGYYSLNAEQAEILFNLGLTILVRFLIDDANQSIVEARIADDGSHGKNSMSRRVFYHFIMDVKRNLRKKNLIVLDRAFFIKG